MARTFPTPAALVLPDPARVVPRARVLAGSAAKPGHPRDLGRILNLCKSTYRCGAVVSQGWAEGQNVDTSVGMSERHVYRIPRISSGHVSARLIARVDATAGGQVRLERPDAVGQTSAVFAAPGFVSTAAVDLSGQFTTHVLGDYVDLTVLVEGTDIKIDDLMVHIDPIDAGGAWPGGDGTLAAGTVDGAVAFDDVEFDPDRPLSARLARAIDDTIEAIETRPRILRTWSGILDETGVREHKWLTQYAHKSVIPVHAETRSRERLATVWVRAYNDEVDDFEVVIQHGPGGRDALDRAIWLDEDSRYISRINIPKSTPALSWYSTTVRIPEVRDYAPDFPGVYPGLTNLHFGCKVGSVDQGVVSFSAWTV